MSKPTLPNWELLIASGYNPATGKFDSKMSKKKSINQVFEEIDRADAVNRYQWYNIPCNLTSAEIERMLYYKGQLAFFYNADLEEFYFMPFALDGTIDFYGRYNTIHPVPMTSGVADDKSVKAQADVLSAIKLKCYYDVVPDEKVTYETMTKGAVILKDRTNGLSQNITPRVQVNKELIDIESDIVPYLSTALLASTGIQGMRVSDADQYEAVSDASKSVKDNALAGNPWIPITSALEFQELTGKNGGSTQDFLLALQSLDNLRLRTHGIQNGGVFEKQGAVLNHEFAVNSNPSNLIYEDGLLMRQNFCNIVNSIWNLGIWCTANEAVVGADLDGDGDTIDDRDAHKPIEAAEKKEESANETNV